MQCAFVTKANVSVVKDNNHYILRITRHTFLHFLIKLTKFNVRPGSAHSPHSLRWWHPATSSVIPWAPAVTMEAACVMHAEFRNLPLKAAHMHRHAVTDIRSRADTRTAAVLGWCLCSPLGLWRYSSGLVYQQAEIPSSLVGRNIEYLYIVWLCKIWLKRATLWFVRCFAWMSNFLPHNYILITNLMQKLLFIHIIIHSSTFFEP